MVHTPPTHLHTHDSPSMPSIFILFFIFLWILFSYPSNESFKESNQLHQKIVWFTKSTKNQTAESSPRSPLLALWYRSLWLHFYCVGTRSYPPRPSMIQPKIKENRFETSSKKRVSPYLTNSPRSNDGARHLYALIDRTAGYPLILKVNILLTKF